MIEQLQEALGPNYTVRKGYGDCDADVDVPDPMGGGVTVCFKQRRWCPGGALHAGGGIKDANGNYTWFGVHQTNPSRYKGRGWVAKIAEDIKEAVRVGTEDIIVNNPGWLRGMTPDEARESIK